LTYETQSYKKIPCKTTGEITKTNCYEKLERLITLIICQNAPLIAELIPPIAGASSEAIHIYIDNKRAPLVVSQTPTQKVLTNFNLLPRPATCNLIQNAQYQPVKNEMKKPRLLAGAVNTVVLSEY
jgi:hypothetical protein